MYERTSPIVTTNLPFEQWVEVMGSERMTGALPANAVGIGAAVHRVRAGAGSQLWRRPESRVVPARGLDVCGIDEEEATIEILRRVVREIRPDLPAENFRAEPIEDDGRPLKHPTSSCYISSEM